jgi:hypothetical protein
MVSGIQYSHLSPNRLSCDLQHNPEDRTTRLMCEPSHARGGTVCNLNPRRRPMEKVESKQVERVLRDEELNMVNGGFGFIERFTNPLLIYGFNPQPDPPGAPVGR